MCVCVCMSWDSTVCRLFLLLSFAHLFLPSILFSICFFSILSFFFFSIFSSSSSSSSSSSLLVGCSGCKFADLGGGIPLAQDGKELRHGGGAAGDEALAARAGQVAAQRTLLGAAVAHRRWHGRVHALGRWRHVSLSNGDDDDDDDDGDDDDDNDGDDDDDDDDDDGWGGKQ